MEESISVQEKIQLAAQFLEDSPPGEFHEVLLLFCIDWIRCLMVNNLIPILEAD